MPLKPFSRFALGASLALACLAAGPTHAQDSHLKPVIIDARDITPWVYKDPPYKILPTDIPDLRAPVREVINILTEYAHKRDPNFKVFIRGGEFLATQTQRDLDLALLRSKPGDSITQMAQLPLGTPHKRFVRNIAGIVLDQRYCAPVTNTLDDAGLARLKALDLKLIAFERCADAKAAEEAHKKGQADGVWVATTDQGAHPFGTVPRERPANETAAKIQTLDQVRSLLVALEPYGYERMEDWLRPLINNNYDLLIVEPFFNGNMALTKEHVTRLKSKALGGQRLVMAHLTLGLAQDTLPYWKDDWKVGNPAFLTGYFPGQSGLYWVNIQDKAWLELMGKGFASLMDLGFDGLILDGVTTFLRDEALMPI